MLTLQQIFDKSANHLLTQRAKSYLFEGSTQCGYRGQDGKQCAAGPFIPDELYENALEHNGVIQPIVQKAMPEIDWQGENVFKLMRALQDCHDGVGVENWPRQLMRIANDFQLNVDVFFKTPQA